MQHTRHKRIPLSRSKSSRKRAPNNERIKAPNLPKLHTKPNNEHNRLICLLYSNRRTALQFSLAHVDCIRIHSEGYLD